MLQFRVRAAASRPRAFAMMETNPIRRQIEDLSQRADALRRYL
jgi:hypothetical protein